LIFSRAPGIGLDIGNKKIKLVRIKRGGQGVKLVDYGCKFSPPGSVEAGMIQDPERLGERLGELVDDMKMSKQPAVSVVAGPQVYIRNFVMPRMKSRELKTAVRYESSTFLPIPIDEAAIDISPLQYFEDEEGKKVEVFFVAVRKLQVENLRLACEIAGLKLAAVEIEPLALHRLSSRDPSEQQVFVNVGASRSTFSVFKGEALIFNRHLSFGCSAFAQSYLHGQDTPFTGLQSIEIGSSGEHQYLVRDMIAELARAMEYYNMQKSETINNLWLCGGGAQLKGLDQALSEGINCPVSIFDSLRRVEIPDNIDETVRKELKYDYAVALGLAARGVI